MVDSLLYVLPLEAALVDGWRDDLKNRWTNLRSESGKVTLEEASFTVSHILDSRFSKGPSLSEQFVLGVFDAGRIVGSFWLEIKGSKAFLYDAVSNGEIEIKILLALLENEAVSRGALELRVNVFSGDELLENLTSSEYYVTQNSQMWLLDNPEDNQREVDPDFILRAMTQDEFQDYLKWKIETGATEKVRAGQCTLEDSLSESIQEVERLLPDGLRSEGQFIFIAEFRGQRVGTVWVDIDKEMVVSQAFIAYIEIEQPLRGQGLGRELMYATRLECRRLGAKGFALSVFGHNSIAKNLYESFGFEVTEVMKRRVLAQ